MDELKPCHTCNKPAEHYRRNIRCSNLECVMHYVNVPEVEWQSRPGEAAAEQRGYERALDVAMLTIGHNRDPQETITIYEVVMKLGKLKSEIEALELHRARLAKDES